MKTNNNSLYIPGCFCSCYGEQRTSPVINVPNKIVINVLLRLFSWFMCVKQMDVVHWQLIKKGEYSATPVTFLQPAVSLHYVYIDSMFLLTLRWSGAPGPGLRLHLRDGVPHQGRERVPEPAAHGPQRAAHAEKHAAGDQVSLMDHLIRFSTLIFMCWFPIQNV